MLLYNWHKIYAAAQGSAVECYRIFDMITFSKLPKNKFDPIYSYSQMNFTGKSFLKHPEVLIYNSYRYKRRDVCIYLALASLRSFAAYKISDTLTLDLLHSPVDPRDYLYDTDLLPVKDGLIHFPYEED